MADIRIPDLQAPDFSFKRLQADHPESLKFLGVATFLIPDNIPQTLFEFDDESDIIEGFEFCSDEFGYVWALAYVVSLMVLQFFRSNRTSPDPVVDYEESR